MKHRDCRVLSYPDILFVGMGNGSLSLLLKRSEESCSAIRFGGGDFWLFSLQ